MATHFLPHKVNKISKSCPKDQSHNQMSVVILHLHMNTTCIYLLPIFISYSHYTVLSKREEIKEFYSDQNNNLFEIPNISLMKCKAVYKLHENKK